MCVKDALVVVCGVYRKDALVPDSCLWRCQKRARCKKHRHARTIPQKERQAVPDPQSIAPINQAELSE